MELLGESISVLELAKRANLSSTIFYMLKDTKGKVENLNNFSYLRIKNIPKRFEKVAKDCLRLDNYLPYTYLARNLGLGDSYFFVREKLGDVFEHKRIEEQKTKLMKLDDSFLQNMQKGLTPFAIVKDFEEMEKLATVITMLQNKIKIGWY